MNYQILGFFDNLGTIDTIDRKVEVTVATLRITVFSDHFFDIDLLRT